MPWTNISKPTESSIITLNAGEPLGLLLAITVANTISSTISGWGNVNKPAGLNWTNISKPTGSGWTNINKPTD